MNENSRAAVCGIERLEARIAPADVTFAGKSATWTDWDGDTVTMKWTATLGPNLNHYHANGGGIVMDEIILANDGDAITVNVKAAPGGDGRVDLGYINATGLPLKSFRAPKATVLEFDCGDTSRAIGMLQIAGYGTVPPSQFTTPGGDGIGWLDGDASSIKISGDLDYGKLQLGDNIASYDGNITIGGSLHGNVRDATGEPGGFAGYLETLGKAGVVKIGHDIIGGAASRSGLLEIYRAFTSLAVGGDVVGGTMATTGEIELLGIAGPISVGVLSSAERTTAQGRSSGLPSRASSLKAASSAAASAIRRSTRPWARSRGRAPRASPSVTISLPAPSPAEP